MSSEAGADNAPEDHIDHEDDEGGKCCKCGEDAHHDRTTPVVAGATKAEQEPKSSQTGS